MMIVTLCGSVRLGKEIWDRMAQKLTLNGWCVFTVNVWGMYDYLHSPSEVGKSVKEQLDLIHKQKIAISNKIVVLRKEGYIGYSTRSEINFAESIGIPIEYIEVDSLFKEEER